MSESSLIDQFISITSSTPEVAQFYIESTEGNLELAISQYFENPNPTITHNNHNTTTTITNDYFDEISDIDTTTIPRKRSRDTGDLSPNGTPIAQSAYTDTLLGNNNNTVSSSSTLDDMSLPLSRTQYASNPFVSYGTRRSNNRNMDNSTPWNDDRLSQLFKSPHYALHGSFYDAIQRADTLEKWLLVNIQDNDVFNCHALNRDIWNNSNIERDVLKYCILWQCDSNSNDVQQYNTYYRQHQATSGKEAQIYYPYIAIVDPRTRQKMYEYTDILDEKLATNTKRKQQEFIHWLNEIILKEGLPSNDTNMSNNQTAIDSVVDLTSTANDDDNNYNNHIKSPDELSYEEQYQRAIAESLVEDNNNNNTNVNNNNNINSSVEYIDEFNTRDSFNTNINVNNHNNNTTMNETIQNTTTNVSQQLNPKQQLINDIKNIQLSLEPTTNSNDVTRLQFRIGIQRIQRRFNKTDTVGLLYRYIYEQCNNQQKQQGFILVTTQPKRTEYTDITQTLQDVQLLNSSIVVEFDE